MGSANAKAIVLADGLFLTSNGKTAHGLVRGSDRFEILAVTDPSQAGQDAGELLDGIHRGIPIVSSIAEALATHRGEPPRYAIVGIATHGGHFTPELRGLLLEALHSNLSIVNGLHDYVSDDPELRALAAQRGLEIIDLRKPKPKSELHFWSGAICAVRAPRIAVLGTDCSVGKRTTTRLLIEALNQSGVKAEMIYTGQTGWIQGARYGFVLDSVVNDYVSGELEHAIVSCDREAQPDVMIIEGQSSLRNPSGPCGAELLLSGDAHGVILQHAAGREFFAGHEETGFRIPPVADEIKLIESYGARTLAVALSGENTTPERLLAAQEELQTLLDMPVIRPLQEGVSTLVPLVRRFIEESRP